MTLFFVMLYKKINILSSRCQSFYCHLPREHNNDLRRLPIFYCFYNSLIQFFPAPFFILLLNAYFVTIIQWDALRFKFVKYSKTPIHRGHFLLQIGLNIHQSLCKQSKPYLTVNPGLPPFFFSKLHGITSYYLLYIWFLGVT